MEIFVQLLKTGLPYTIVLVVLNILHIGAKQHLNFLGTIFRHTCTTVTLSSGHNRDVATRDMRKSFLTLPVVSVVFRKTSIDSYLNVVFDVVEVVFQTESRRASQSHPQKYL